MSRADRVLDEALRLSSEDRAHVVAALQESLQAEAAQDSHGAPLATGELELRVELCVRQGQLEEGLRLVDAAARSVPESAWARRVDTAVLRGQVLARQGELEEASGVLDRALRLATTHGCDRRQALVQWRLAGVASQWGRRDEETFRCERALERFAALGDRVLEAKVRIHLGFAHHEAGRLDQAEGIYDEALACVRGLGLKEQEAVVLTYLGWLKLERGRQEQGRDLLERACALHEAVGNPRFQGASFYCLAHRHLRVGALAEARRAIDAGLACTATLEDATVRALLSMAAGMLSSRQGQHAQACASFRDARRLFRAAGDTLELRSLAAHVLEGLVELAEGARERASARLEAVVLQHGEAPPSSDLRMAMAVVRRALETSRPGGPWLVLGPDAKWFELSDCERVSLRRRRSLRGVLKALATADGSPRTWEELFAAGWPNDKADPEAGHRRVRTAVWTLRRMGLGDRLQTTPEGYRMASELRVAWEP